MLARRFPSWARLKRLRVRCITADLPLTLILVAPLGAAPIGRAPYRAPAAVRAALTVPATVAA